MLKLIQNLLGGGAAMSEADEKDRVQVATCVLLLEMAHSDGELHDLEGALIEDLLQKKFSLSAETTAELLQLADGERQSSFDLHQFTRQINENFSIEEKLEVLEGLWRIVYADGVLDKYEEHLMRQLASLLRLSHRQMIDAKLKVRDEVQPDR